MPARPVEVPCSGNSGVSNVRKPLALEAEVGCCADAERSGAAARRKVSSTDREAMFSTSDERVLGTRGCARRPVPRPPRSPSCGTDRDPRSRGPPSPNVSAAANRNGRGKKRARANPASGAPAHGLRAPVFRESAWRPRRAGVRPSVPPAASSRLSRSKIVRPCLPRPAPSAVRTATSRSRAALRDSNRFAKLTQAINSSATDAPAAGISAVRFCPAISSRSGVTITRNARRGSPWGHL